MGWLAGYAYRSAISIAHTVDGAQTAYQNTWTINKAAGVNAAGVLYLGGLALAWPNDIRFTESDGTTTDSFYRRFSDANTGTWLQKADIPASGNWTGYIYWGKTSDTDASSISGCFGVGNADDFEWGVDEESVVDNLGNITWGPGSTAAVLDTARYKYGSKSMRISRIAGTNGYVDWSTTPLISKACGWYVYKEDAPASGVNYGGVSKRVSLNWRADDWISYYDGSEKNVKYIAPNQWLKIELTNINLAAGTFDIWLNDIKEKAGATMFNAGSGNTWEPGTVTANGNVWFDNVMLRTWTANEPVVGTPGATEYAPKGGSKFLSVGRERDPRRMIFHKTLKLK